MTQAELDALPEDGTFGMIEEVIDGKTIRRPVLNSVGALWVAETEPCMVTDAYGNLWRIGWANGVRYKRRR